MNQELNIVVIRVTRYSDSHSILSAYSRELGRVALLVPAGRSRAATRLRAMTMPLALLRCQAELRPGRDILKMSQTEAVELLPNILASPSRRMTAQFLAEVLSVVLRESQADEAVFSFISRAVTLLDRLPDRGIANFHIAFLYRLAGMIGIEPDTSTYAEGYIFDMKEGIFRPSAPLHHYWLSGDEARVAAQLDRMRFDNMALFRFSRAERNRVLDVMLDYYSIHYAPLKSLQSLGVLRTLL